MPNEIISDAIQSAQDLSIQSRARGEISNSLSLVWWLAKAGLTTSLWWSPARDRELRDFWKQPDHLAGAVYAMEAKMTAIPFRIVPLDYSIKEYVDQANQYTDLLLAGAEFGEGWPSFYGRFVEDLLTQDNGCFAEIIGYGPRDGPIIGRPLTIAHLDSWRCQRTGNPEFPVIFRDITGKQYKLHWTRVMFMAQMSSPIAEMFGVGFCATSRCTNVAQSLLDILIYKQEKLGSRPHRGILVTQGGLDPMDVRDAFQVAGEEMDSQRLSRYSKFVLVGSQSMMNADIKAVDLSSLPDGFNEETSLTLGMASIALAFGVDARELFPAMSAGATRADALLQHLKQRGKGPGQIIQGTEQLFNHKFLPPHLRMEFDFQDDAQDRQVAEIKNIRALRRASDLRVGAVNVRVTREQMLEVGDLNRGQFERLELEDGRLADGTSIIALFFTKDRFLRKYLDLPVEDPTDVAANDPEAIIPAIHKQIINAQADMVNEKSEATRQELFKATKALEFLELSYKKALLKAEMEEAAAEGSEGEGGDSEGGDESDNPGGAKRQRQRSVDLTQPNLDGEMSVEDTIRPSYDDREE